MCCILVLMQSSSIRAEHSSVGPWLLLSLTFAVVAGIVLWSTLLWDQAIRTVDGALRAGSGTLAADVSGKRFYLEDDSYFWASFAREMVLTGTWRIRYTHIDNVPFGREVEWSQCFSWLLVLSAWLRHIQTGEPLASAIEPASIWINPLLLIICSLGFSWLIYRRMGAVIAAVFAFTLISIGNIGWNYHPFRPDHQGLHIAFSFGAMLFLILSGLGWQDLKPTEVEPRKPCLPAHFIPLELPSLQNARRYFIASGILTGLGLWIGATVHFFNIVSIIGAMLLIALFIPKRLRITDRLAYVPELWRSWALSAALVGFALYLVEYFPHLQFRLESNNPFFHLDLLCAGELMLGVTGWRLCRRPISFRGGLRLGIFAVGAALVPILFVFGPSTLHNLRDVEMTRLTQFVTEGQTYFTFQKGNLLAAWFRAFGFVPLFLAGPLLLSRHRRLETHEWAALWLSFSVCIVYFALMLWEVRWAGSYAISNVWLAALVAGVAWRSSSRGPGSKDFLAFVCLAGLLVGAQDLYFLYREYTAIRPIVERRKLTEEFLDQAMKKRLAQALGKASKGQQLRILCEPDLAGSIYYFAHDSTVISHHFENLQGLHDATGFFTDRRDSAARQIAIKRGLTHVLVPDDDQLPAMFNYIRTGNRSTKEVPSTLLARLQRGDTNSIPAWITRDDALTAIGRQKFLYIGALGTAPIDSRITVFRLHPENTAEKTER